MTFCSEVAELEETGCCFGQPSFVFPGHAMTTGGGHCQPRMRRYGGGALGKSEKFFVVFARHPQHRNGDLGEALPQRLLSAERPIHETAGHLATSGN